MNEVEYRQMQVVPAAVLGQLTTLLEQVFGITSFPSSDQHFIALHQGKVVGHAALVPRQVSLGTWTGELFFLGLVAVDPSMRHQGLGTTLVSQAVRWAKSGGSNGVILNCGTTMTGFYEAAGFQRIADRASYLRQGAVQVDEDPVMLYPFGRVDPGLVSDVFLGEDF